MARSPQRRAWVVLLLSLFACCALVVGVPAISIAFVNNASDAPNALVQLQAGKVSTFDANEIESADAKVVAITGREVTEGTTIVVDADLDSVAGLVITAKDGAQVTMQLYSGTRLRIERLRLPRYTMSSASDSYVLNIERGRIEVQTDYPSKRKLSLRLVSPQTQSIIGAAGAFGVDVDAQRTVLIAYEGEIATTPITNSTATRYVRAGERVAVQAGSPQPLLTARNIIRNGDFSQPLQEINWVVSTTAKAGSALGKATILMAGAAPRLDLNRTGPGLGPGRTSVTQLLNQSVANRQSVNIRLTFEIEEQEIPVCGGTGSECPLMIDIVYQRADGSEGHWRQGFYSVGVPNDTGLPDNVVVEKQS